MFYLRYVVTAKNTFRTLLSIQIQLIRPQFITLLFLLKMSKLIWVMQRPLEERLDAFDTWCLRKILRIPYTRHTTNETVRSITGCLPVSDRVKSYRLRFFGHLACSAPEEDHRRVIAAALRPPTDWRRPIGRPRATWLRTIDVDVQPQNFRVHTAWIQFNPIFV